MALKVIVLIVVPGDKTVQAVIQRLKGMGYTVIVEEKES